MNHIAPYPQPWDMSALAYAYCCWRWDNLLEGWGNSRKHGTPVDKKAVLAWWEAQQ